MYMDTIKIVSVPISSLKPATYNPRTWNKDQLAQLCESITRFGCVDPIIVNSASERENVVIGGHMRLKALAKLGRSDAPVVYVTIPDLAKEQELNLRLNRNTGEFDFKLLAAFDDSLLKDVGFTSEEIDEIFATEPTPESWSLTEELEKLDIKKVSVEKGQVYDLDGSRLMCGDSTVESDMLTLMGAEKAAMVMTDPPYILEYLKGKSKQKDGVTRGFGAKKNRVYLGTETLPENFSDLWMANVAKVQKKDFSIIVFEHPKNLKTIWTALEAHWKYRGTIVWHVPNRMQGFSGKYKFFNKHDIALVGSTPGKGLNLADEGELFRNEYENALFATSGTPQWEGYEKGKKVCPTDFITHIAADKKSSGQGIIFGTKPIELLIPYIKVLTRRGDLVLEPFGGSGSTLVASLKIGRRCFVMEKSPVYAEVILRRWKLLTGKEPKLL